MKSFLKFLIPMIIIAWIGTSLVMCRTKEGPPPVDKTERNVVIYNMDDDEDTFKKVLRGYLDKHPYVDVTYKKFDDFADYEKLILDELAEGEGPDIFAMPNSWFVKNKGKVSPMPDSMGSPDDFRSIYVGVVANDLLTQNTDGIEKVYGVPMFVDSLALYYNQDHFEDRLPGKGKPSGTWDGIKGNVISLMKTAEGEVEVAGVAMGTVGNVSYPADILYNLMIQHGVVFYDDIMKEALFSESNDYAAVDAMNLYVSFADPSQRHFSWDEDLALDYFAGDVTAFLKGEVSMIFGYSSMYDYIMSQRKIASSKGLSVIDADVVKTAPMPQLLDPTDSTEKRDVYGRYYAFGVSRNSEHSDVAWDILTYLGSPEAMNVYFEETNRPTSRRDMLAKQRLHPIFGVFVDQAGFAESFAVVDYLKFDEMIAQAISYVLEGATPRDALKNVQEKVQVEIPKNGYVTPLDEEYYEETLGE
ncbi:extracellular solute-binding protein [Candidatus Peregrinibacteria bacterium]|jgi:ABC-type glycerol-3-phosphate transport system substrate-binding protein|nr:extracellular solute-binding protein [Candidatus Peregrinibacteria bacterium]MBT4056415.1 extracellular solute-binding protein [Candidatus Peregrinibacteria bacterium]